MAAWRVDIFDGVGFFVFAVFEHGHEGEGLGGFDEVFAVFPAFASDPVAEVLDVAPFDFAGAAFFALDQVGFVADGVEQAADECAGVLGRGAGAAVFNQGGEGGEAVAAAFGQGGRDSGARAAAVREAWWVLA